MSTNEPATGELAFDSRALRASRRVWALVAVGLTAGAVTLAAFVVSTYRARANQATMNTFASGLDKFIAGVDDLLSEAQREVTVELAGREPTPQGVESSPGPENILAEIKFFLQSPAEEASVVELRQALTKVNEFRGQARRWLNEYRATEKTAASANRRVDDALRRMREYLEHAAGHERLQRALALRRFHAGGQNPDPRLMEGLIELEAGMASLPDAQKELADLELLNERLQNDRGIDRLADLEDNQFHPTLSRLRRETLRIAGANEAAIPQTRKLNDEVLAALFGDGAWSDDEHQTIVRTENGAFSIRLRRLTLERERNELQARLATLLTAVDRARSEVEKPIRKEMHLLAAASADGFETAFRYELGVALICNVLFVSLSIPTARTLRRQFSEILSATGAAQASERRTQEANSSLKEEIQERARVERELESTHQQLMEASRRSGMAEIATGVLHNVGNVLNSVNISATLVRDRMQQSKIDQLTRVCGLLEEHGPDMGQFITQDPKGKQVPGFLKLLSGHLADERADILQELEALTSRVDHIKTIVAAQQSYAGVSGVIEPVNVQTMLEDAIKMNASSFEKHDIQVEREYAGLPTLLLDKQKILQILVNLVKNAKDAVLDPASENRQICLRTQFAGDNRFQIVVSDAGVGIPRENLLRLFSHGFTTKKTGHGFGLHNCANTAKEMGGSLTAYSDGPGRGAAFILELPLQPAEVHACSTT